MFGGGAASHLGAKGPDLPHQPPWLSQSEHPQTWGCGTCCTPPATGSCGAGSGGGQAAGGAGGRELQALPNIASAVQPWSRAGEQRVHPWDATGSQTNACPGAASASHTRPPSLTTPPTTRNRSLDVVAGGAAPVAGACHLARLQAWVDGNRHIGLSPLLRLGHTALVALVAPLEAAGGR